MHSLNKTMRTNMFQQWIDRVLENKHKIKQQLHLGTEFEYTRFVDKKGYCIDPFVPKFDITKMQNLEKELKSSQKINVDSPRFINTLERALVKLFTEADVPVKSDVVQYSPNEPGELNYSQFFNSFASLPYDLTHNDMRLLLAIADENPNGRITWRDFIPVGIEAIKTFLARNKLMQKEKILTKEINPETLMLVYKHQAAMATKYLMRKFKSVDVNEETKEHSGFVSFAFMQECFSRSSMLTIKERNLLLREYVMKHGYEKIKYENLEADLIEARIQLLNNRKIGRAHV